MLDRNYGISLKTSPAWVTLPTATLLPAQLSKFTKARKFLYRAKYAFDKVEYIGTQGAIPQKTTMKFSVNYS
jgi:hypothetical protein